MRRNAPSLLFFLSFVVSLFIFDLMDSIALAGGAPPLKGCEDLKNNPVPTEYDRRLPSFAKVVVNRSGKHEKYIIVVNPSHYYLSRETQQWLYLRQCAHIRLKHDYALHAKNEKPNLREEREADCWAITRMLKDKQYRFSERGISKIQRDIEDLARSSERWRDIFGGPRRRVYTYDCAYKKSAK